MPNYDDIRLNLPAGGDQSVMQVNAGVLALRKTPEPDAEMVSQILHGETVTLHHEVGEFALVQNHTDGYVGWALLEGLSAPVLAATHRICVSRIHSYADPSIRAAPHHILGMGARLITKDARENGYIKCHRSGWVKEDLLAPVDTVETDPATVAEQFTGTPYLWGGRDCLGVDCSGLIQLAFGACGMAAPRDSDMQYAWFGDSIDDWRTPGLLQRNDLVFWRGHVGLMLNPETLLHANAHHMAVAAEPLDQAITRIAVMHGEPIGARRLKIIEPDRMVPAWLSV